MSTTEFRRNVPPKRVLVVEDEALAAQTIRMVLSADRHTVDIAEDGEKGLAMFGATPYDLVIADFQLGKMDGLELAEAIKRLEPGTPIILVTAYAEQVGGTMGKVSNIDVLLKKPFSVADLQSAITKVFPAA